jgi:hypothetical protein
MWLSLLCLFVLLKWPTNFCLLDFELPGPGAFAMRRMAGLACSLNRFQGDSLCIRVRGGGESFGSVTRSGGKFDRVIDLLRRPVSQDLIECRGELVGLRTEGFTDFIQPE